MGLNVKSKQWQALDSKRQQAQATVMETSAEWQQLHLRVHMFTACAVINLQVLPDKLNPLVRPLMEAIKREENTLVQGFAASFIAKLLQQCAGRSPCPNPKIIKNLCSSACMDSVTTPSSACPVPPTQENAKGYTSVFIFLLNGYFESTATTFIHQACINSDEVLFHAIGRWFGERWHASHG